MKASKMSFFFGLALLAPIFMSPAYAAEGADSKAEAKSEAKTEVPANAPSDTKKSKHFEIVEGTANLSGEPGADSAKARAEWKTACDDWKSETKALNKSNQVVSLVCGKADCAYQENGSYVCSSIAAYTLKIEGVRVPPPPVATPVPKQEAKQEPLIDTAPPPLVVEVTPPPQRGFIWAPGYWVWAGSRHVWYPGRWIAERPGYYWHGHQWVHRDNGWYFESGRWDRRRR